MKKTHRELERWSEETDVKCKGCNANISDGRFCSDCERDILAHLDQLAAQERAHIEAIEICIDEQLRKNHGQ